MSKTRTYILRSTAIAIMSAAALCLTATASAGNIAAPQTAGALQHFDPARIDHGLYAHQKVGQPYTVSGKTYRPAHAPKFDQSGKMSWYGAKFQGKLTASGERFDKNALTAAHKTLPLNSLVVVTNVATGKKLTVRINDRGPFVGNGIIDLSEAAASRLGFTSSQGHIRVQYAGPAIPVKTAPSAEPQKIAKAFVPQITLPAPQAQIPQAYIQEDLGDDQTTVMTIKGPIHSA